MTAADQWQEAIAQLAPMERQGVLANVLEVVTDQSEAARAMGYIVDSGSAVLATHWPTGGTWAKKSRGRTIRARGLTREHALHLARAEIDDLIWVDRVTMAIARPTHARGLVVGWTLARGQDLLLCYTLEGMRQCGVQRLIWAQVFPDGRPKRHAYEPRGTAEFLRRIGTDYAR